MGLPNALSKPEVQPATSARRRSAAQNGAPTTTHVKRSTRADFALSWAI